jgi:serine protease Do
MKKTIDFKILLLVLTVLLFLPGTNTCGRIISLEKHQKPSTGESTASASEILNRNIAFAEGKTASIADVAESSIASVVNISSTRVIKMDKYKMFPPFFGDPFFENFFGKDFFFNIPKEQREQSLGSGVIVSQDGIVLTNNHVVENMDEIKVMLADGKKFEAEIIGTDPKTDVAVIRLKGNIKNLRPMPFGDSNSVRLGDVVIAIGNPFGLGHTVSMGIISAKGRANVGITDYEDFIQTDAAINPGNSGGALVNMKGELIGINTAILSRSGGYQGIGFAIPSNMAKSVMNSLLKYGKVMRGWLGVTIQDMNEDIANAMGLKSTKGAIVSDVLKDSPAQKADIRRGDVIVKINGQTVESSSQVRNKIAELGSGTEAEITVIRDGKEKVIKVKLGEMPGEKTVAEKEKTYSKENIAKGLSVAPLSPSIRQEFNIPSDISYGVVVTQIEPDSPADETGLRPGDVILEVNKKKINSEKEFWSEIEKTANSVLLLVWRDGNTIFMVLQKSK